MRVLVCAASRHSATMEIAVEIGDRIERVLGRGAVDVRPVHRVDSIDQYDAVVLGSAVYRGQWLPEATRFARTQAEPLRTKQVWLFSSGPVGHPPTPEEGPAGAGELVAVTGAHAHVVFAGRLDRRVLRFGERVLVRVLRKQSGDSRDWPAIAQWARGIGRALAQARQSRRSGDR